MLREEISGRESFYSLKKAKVLVEQWRREYNTIWTDSSLSYCPPAPEAIGADRKFRSLALLQGPHTGLHGVGLTHVDGNTVGVN